MREIEERVAKAIHAKHAAPDDNQHWFHEKPDRCELSRQLARAAIAAMPGWQPMETAPKDETSILACDAGADEWFLVVWWDNGHWVTMDGPGYHDASLTHWMPLPAPPAILPQQQSTTQEKT